VDTYWITSVLSVNVNLPQTGTGKLIGCANTQARPQSKQAGYQLRVSNTGAWSVVRNDTTATLTTLASGTTTALGTGSWHTLSLRMQGSSITAKIGSTTLATVTDTAYATGQVGFGLVGYHTDQFDNLSVTPGTVSSGQIASGIAGKCLAAKDTSGTNGTPVVIAACAAGNPAQTWTVAGNAVQLGGKCLDVTGKGTADGTLVELWTCNGGTNQQWTAGANSSLVGTGSGKCLDDPKKSTVDGTQQQIWTCNGGTNQVWTLPG